MQKNNKKVAFILLSFLEGTFLFGSQNRDVFANPSSNITSPEDIGETPFIPSTPPPTPPPSLPPSTPPPSLPPSTPPPTLPPSTPPPSLPPATPPPPATPEVCSYISGSLNDMGTRHGRYYGDIFEKSGDNTKFGCIDQLISQVKASAKNWKQFWNDDSYAITLANIVFPDRSGKSQKVGVHSNGAICDRLYNGDVPKGKNFCGVGRFFMDAKTCQIISVPKGIECAKFQLNYLKGCPVSLIWDETNETKNKSTIVQFSLSNNKSDWTIWKGSEKNPLLVYDPLRSGKINSADQLFGEWTFGGQKTASLVNNNTKNDLNSANPKPWKDGFSALATLDTDRNGKVDGKELDVLSLWFDRNQDAISQEGEVKNINELGVTALYYNFAQKELNGDLVMQKGFERNISGTVKYGKSIDWYSEVSSSPVDLLNLYTMYESFESMVLENDSDIASSEISETESLPGDPSKFSGLWKWSINNKGKDEFAGYLTFTRADTSGNLIGFSVNENLLAISPDEKVKAGSGIFTLDGFETLANGRNKITFKSNYADSTIQSHAFLSSSGTRLNGSSTAETTINGEKVALTYYWTATKE
jgi:hypothetical protein